MVEAHVWVDADGSERRLDGSDGVKVLTGTDGHGMPPVEFAADDLVGMDGARLRSVRYGATDVVLPLFVHAPGSARGLLRQLARFFDPARGDGTLRLETDDGGREIVCRYAEGLSLERSADTGGRTWQKAVVVFRAHHPFWRDAAETTRVFTTSAPTLFPFFAMELAGDTVTAEFTVDNNGDVDVWPWWTIRGPAVDPVLANVSSGVEIAVSGSLAAGETLVVDTRPGVKTVVGPGGVNWYPRLSDASRLWPLVRGSNTLRVDVTDTTADTRVALGYRQEWLTA